MLVPNRKTHPREWNSWKGMIRRCYDRRCEKYRTYGARGVLVCDRWRGDHGFANFVQDMGPRPPGKTIERIDNALGYHLENCTWATVEQQNRNRPYCVLTDLHRDMIDVLYPKGFGNKRIGRAFGVPPTTVQDYINGRTWSDKETREALRDFGIKRVVENDNGKARAKRGRAA